MKRLLNAIDNQEKDLQKKLRRKKRQKQKKSSPDNVEKDW